MIGPLLKVWKEYCFALNWFGPFQQTETDVMLCKEGKNMETGSRTMPLYTTVFFIDDAVTASGLPAITGWRDRVSVHKYVHKYTPATTERDR